MKYNYNKGNGVLYFSMQNLIIINISLFFATIGFFELAESNNWTYLNLLLTIQFPVLLMVKIFRKLKPKVKVKATIEILEDGILCAEIGLERKILWCDIVKVKIGINKIRILSKYTEEIVIYRNKKENNISLLELGQAVLNGKESGTSPRSHNFNKDKVSEVEVEVSYELEDLILCSEFLIKNNSKIKAFYNKISIAISGAMGIGVGIILDSYNNSLIITTMTVVIIILIMFFAMKDLLTSRSAIRGITSKRAEEYKLFESNNKSLISLGEMGFFDENQCSYYLVTWEKITGIYYLDEYIIMIYNEIVMEVIPNKSFKTAEGKEKFIEVIEKYKQI